METPEAIGEFIPPFRSINVFINGIRGFIRELSCLPERDGSG
jgi:hypothetical protein